MSPPAHTLWQGGFSMKCAFLFGYSAFLFAIVSTVGTAASFHEEPQPDRPKAKASACQPLNPGGHLSGARYLEHMRSLQTEFSLDRLRAFNRAVDQEGSRALYEIFSKINEPDTQIFYTNYTNGVLSTPDGGDGFRVVMQRTVGGRLLSVITFWRNDGNGGFELAGGQDALRVRVQVAPARRVQGEQFGVFAAASYDVTTQKDRTSLAPGFYQKANGDQADPKARASYHANAVNCAGCHQTFANRGLLDFYESNPRRPGSTREAPLFDEARFDTSRPSEDFLRDALEGVLGPRREAVRTSLTTALRNPRRTFLPPRILEALEARCRLAP